MLERLLQWDSDSLIYLNNLGSESYDGFWSVTTNIATWIPLYLFFGFLLSRKQAKKEALYRIIALIAITVLVLLLTHITKENIARLRPNNAEELNGLIRILKNPDSYSFFSGHAATSFAMTTFLFLMLRKEMRWVWILFFWPLLFTYSRIYVGVHYPLDLIVGAFFGISFAFLFLALYRRFKALYTK